jgi:hypothetical protein
LGGKAGPNWEQEEEGTMEIGMQMGTFGYSNYCALKNY